AVETIVLASRRQRARRVRERGDRRQRIVQLVADHADHFLPGRELLARELAREALDEIQIVRLRVQREAVVRDLEDLGLAVLADGDEAILSRQHGLAQRSWRGGDDVGELASFDLAGAAE